MTEFQMWGGYQQHSELHECWTGCHLAGKIFIRKIRQKIRAGLDFLNVNIGSFMYAFPQKITQMGVAA